ncbi:hypothetical protein APHAL10511_003183 [Amanita phalloides]|nr:hypothetical protein APHAL10511_003183 [Amanita phalloides]
MLRIVKPKNARSKRALEGRAPKEVEDPRTAIFVKGTHVGELLNGVMKELMALKRPHAISFSKRNAIHPFDDRSNSLSSIEFWAAKNDASLFLFGHSSKKRPHGLSFIRLYDGRMLDMIEVAVDKFVSMADFETPKATPGHKPLMHFASDLFDSHPRFMQLKSMLLDFFNAEVIDAICLSGIEYVISVSLGPTPGSLNTAMAQDSKEELPKVHIRTYMIKMVASGVKTPRAELTPMGPFLDLSLRRHQDPDPEMLKQAMKRPKLKKQDVEKGLGKKKKNMDVDEMGNLRGRIHLGKQDLSKLQTKKMKGLKRDLDESGGGEDEGEEGEPQRKKERARVLGSPMFNVARGSHSLFQQAGLRGISRPVCRRGYQLHVGFSARRRTLQFRQARTMSSAITTDPGLTPVSTNAAPAAIGPYSQAIKSGDLLFLSGCIALDATTGQIVQGGVEGQTEQTLRNLKAVVEAGGSSLGKVIKVTVFLKDMNDFGVVNGIYGKFFGDHKPARAAVEVARLPKDALIEIECIARIA